MSVTASTLSTIQQAGQSIDVARLSLIAAVNEHAQRVMTAVADQPFNVDNDKLFASWKTLSRLAQEVNAIEEQFKSIYQSAADLVQPETSVLMALPHTTLRKATEEVKINKGGSPTVEDVQIKPRAAKNAAKRPKVRATRKQGTGALSANDAKLLDYLNTVLDRKSWTRLTQGGMAGGAAIPMGSVGVALRRLLGNGLVLEGDKGRYKLA